MITIFIYIALFLTKLQRISKAIKKKRQTNRDDESDGDKMRLHKNINYQKWNNKTQQHIKHSKKHSDKKKKRFMNRFKRCCLSDLNRRTVSGL